MVEIATNPNLETLKLMLWVLVSLAGIMALIIGWLIVWMVNNNKERGAIFQDQLDKMGGLIGTVEKMAVEIKTVVLVIQNQIQTSAPITEKRLNDHSRTLKNHGNRLVRIETSCKIKHNEITEEETE